MLVHRPRRLLHPYHLLNKTLDIPVVYAPA
jgi:hypothetical protein